MAEHHKDVIAQAKVDAASPRWRALFSILILPVFLFVAVSLSPVLGWSDNTCTPRPKARVQSLGRSGTILAEIRKIDPAQARKEFADKHFQSAQPVVFSKPDASDPKQGVPIHIMTVNFEHLTKPMHEPAQWRQKLVAFGKTFLVEDPDIVAANEVYQGGLDILSKEVLKPLGYAAIIDEAGGKEMPTRAGGRMSVGLIYKPDKVRILKEESIPLDIQAVVPHTRNIFRVTMELTIGGPPFVVYVVHFKSAMFLKEDIELPDGGVIKTSNQIRKLQMILLQSRMEKDMAAGVNAFALGDFNTPFSMKGFVNPDNPIERPFGTTRKEGWMVWSARPFRDFLESNPGEDVLDRVDGYSHVYRKHGSKLDHIILVPGVAETPPPFRFLRAEQLRYLRYPWHLNAKGHPNKGEVSDHLPLSAHFVLVHQAVP